MQDGLLYVHFSNLQNFMRKALILISSSTNSILQLKKLSHRIITSSNILRKCISLQSPMSLPLHCRNIPIAYNFVRSSPCPSQISLCAIYAITVAYISFQYLDLFAIKKIINSIPLLSLLIVFLLKYYCFIMFCNQLCVHIYLLPLGPPSHPLPHPRPLGHRRA